MPVDPVKPFDNFAIGPDKPNDLRQLRPYFVVQLEKAAIDGASYVEPIEGAHDNQVQIIAKYLAGVVNEAEALLLKPDDLAHADALLAKLQDAAVQIVSARDVSQKSADSAATFLCGLFSWRTLRILVNARAENQTIDNPSIISSLTNELNGLLTEGCLYAPNLLPAKDSEGKIIDWASRIDKLIEDDPEQALIIRQELKAVLAGESKMTGQLLLEKINNPDRDRLFTGRARLLVNRLILSLAFPDNFAPIVRKKNVTDVFILSHGWHRNFFAAVAAYDQIVSRFSILMRRQRLTVERPFHPLFLALHWNSDPTEDGWIDPQGRRDKLSFLQIVETVFDRPSTTDEATLAPEERFLNVFEDIFQHFSRLSASDTDALSDEAKIESQELSERLYRFSLRNAPGASEAEKTSAAWTCYFRSQARGFLSAQETNPAPFLSRSQAIKNSLFFVLGIGGTTILLGWFSQIIKHLCNTLWRWSTSLSNLTLTYAHLIKSHLNFIDQSITQKFSTILYVFTDITFLFIILSLVTLAFAVFGTIYLKSASSLSEKNTRDNITKTKTKHSVPVSYLVAWLPVQLLMATPWLFYLFSTYMKPKKKGKIDYKSLFSERIGKRNEAITVEQSEIFKRDSKRKPRYKLAQIARKAVKLYSKAADCLDNAIVTGVDNQIAFWEMQIRGTQAGKTSAEIIAALIKKDREGGKYLSGARIHFLGHSFGGLVILNALRHLILDKKIEEDYGKAVVRAADEKEVHTQHEQVAANDYKQPVIQSVCLLQAAVASSWFSEETTIVNSVKGAIGCIFSAYDTANGFYYPVANNGRYAAGYVGLCNQAGTRPVTPLEETSGTLSSLVSSPNLLYEFFPALKTRVEAAVQAAASQYDKKTANENATREFFEATKAEPQPAPFLVNLDASRIIYAGAKAMGGGHGDIFKDDVTNLCWAVTQMKVPD